MESTFAIFAFAVAAIVFVSVLATLELGRRLGLASIARAEGKPPAGANVVTSAVSWLLTLLLGFTFAGAASRYEHRRELITAQAEVIGAAWLRVDALPADLQTPVRVAFRDYLDAVISTYDDMKLPGTAAAAQQRETIAATRQMLWSRAMAACLLPEGEKARMLLLPSLTEMFVAVEKEQIARRTHPPAIIWVMLAIAIFAAAFLAGHNLAGSPARNWVYAVALAGVVASVTYVIVELEHPRLGAIRVDAFDEVLRELRANIGS